MYRDIWWKYFEISNKDYNFIIQFHDHWAWSVSRTIPRLSDDIKIYTSIRDFHTNQKWTF